MMSESRPDVEPEPNDHLGYELQCFQKKYTSEFWSVCCNCSKMNCQYLLREKKRRRIQCSTHEIFSSWSSYNIFFKILRYISSENTVASGLQCFQKKYTSEFWRICCNCSKMNCQRLPREKKRRRILCSAHKIFSSWGSYNIFFKILRHTSSENTVMWEFDPDVEPGQDDVQNEW